MNTGVSRGAAFDGSSHDALIGDASLVGSRPINEKPAQYQSRLPAMTFGHLRTLSRAGTPPSATIRQISCGYVVEFDFSPTRWILVSTHSKRPRLFQHVDGAANAIRVLGAHPIRLALLSNESLADAPERSPQGRN